MSEEIKQKARKELRKEYDTNFADLYLPFRNLTFAWFTKKLDEALQKRDLQLMEKVMKICTYRDSKFEIRAIYADAVYRGGYYEPVDLINRWDVYKAITNNECTYGYDGEKSQDIAHTEIEKILKTLNTK